MNKIWLLHAHCTNINLYINCLSGAWLRESGFRKIWVPCLENNYKINHIRPAARNGKPVVTLACNKRAHDAFFAWEFTSEQLVFVRFKGVKTNIFVYLLALVILIDYKVIRHELFNSKSVKIVIEVKAAYTLILNAEYSSKYDFYTQLVTRTHDEDQQTNKCAVHLAYMPSDKHMKMKKV